MDVYVIPVAHDRYELYCEPQAGGPLAGMHEAEGAQPGPEPGDAGHLGAEAGWFRRRAVVQSLLARLRRLRLRFSALLTSVEQRQFAESEVSGGWMARMQHRMLAWFAERVAEQRLLWNLGGLTEAVLVYPQDMSFEQATTLMTRKLQRDHDRHRLWLIIDSVGMILSWPLVFVPGPNVLLYYFMLRVGGHWFSMRGASQGLKQISWSGRPCQPLVDLRDAATLDPESRERRVQDVASRLQLPHLFHFFKRVTVRHA